MYGLLCHKLLLAYGQPKIFITFVDYSPFEAVDIYKIMKWKLLMKRDEAGELLGICEM